MGSIPPFPDRNQTLHLIKKTKNPVDYERGGEIPGGGEEGRCGERGQIKRRSRRFSPPADLPETVLPPSTAHPARHPPANTSILSPNTHAVANPNPNPHRLHQFSSASHHPIDYVRCRNQPPPPSPHGCAIHVPPSRLLAVQRPPRLQPGRDRTFCIRCNESQD